MDVTSEEIVISEDLKISKGTIIRLIISIFAVVNVILGACGIKIIPISEEVVSTLVNYGLMIVSFAWSFWKNNSFTKAALAGDVVMHALKDGKIGESEEE